MGNILYVDGGGMGRDVLRTFIRWGRAVTVWVRALDTPRMRLMTSLSRNLRVI